MGNWRGDEIVWGVSAEGREIWWLSRVEVIVSKDEG